MGSRTRSRLRRPLILEPLEPRILLSGVPTYTLKTLANFNNYLTNGNGPSALVTDSKGDFFGTMDGGGADGYGTVFEVAAGSSTDTLVASFNGANGAYPMGGLIRDGAGNLYGTTSAGGIYNDGTVFEIKAGSRAITTLASFNDETNGAAPEAGLFRDAGGNLYGTTQYGGYNNGGTVFELVAGSSAISTLASFSSFSENYGGTFSALVRDGTGNLYGTTSGAGAGNSGTVFELASGSTTITTVAAFSGDGSNGAGPESGVIRDSSGNLYGVTSAGGAYSDGTVFEIKAGRGTITTLASFDGDNGADPSSGLLLDSNGNLYGTTTSGGVIGYGTVFAVAAESTTITVLASFNANYDGLHSALIMNNDGNLYGTSQNGGAYSFGTIYELTPTDQPTQLVFVHQPSNTQAGSPITDSDGNPVTMDIEDANGNVVPWATSSVTLTLSSGTFSDGHTAETVSAASGVATFSNLVIDAAGTYTLTATDSQVPSAAPTSSVTITPGPAAQLAFLQPQTTGQAAGPITDSDGNPVTVEVEDAYNNVVASDSSSVTVTLNTGTFSNPEASGASETAATVNSAATFSDLTINQAETYTLTATDSEVPSSAPTATVTITAGPAYKLAFTESPATGFDKATLAPATVAVEDQYGNVETTDNSTSVTVAIGPGSTGLGTLSGTQSVDAVNGVATFSDLSIDQAVSATGTYTLQATGGALLEADSPSFTITPQPTQLVFVQGPTDALAGGTIAPPVTVEVLDADGNPITGDNSSVTVAIGPGSTGAGPLNGTPTEKTASGIATFGDLSINQVGTYTLTAADSADGLSGFVSGSFNISPAPASKLVFTTPPADSIAGTTLLPVNVTIEDKYGNVETSDNSNVTVAIGPGAIGSGTLNGTLTEAAASGVAAFSDLSITQAGTYTLTAADSADSLSGFVSSNFTLTGPTLAGTWQMAGVLSQGTFTTDDLGGVVGGSIFNNDGTSVTITGGSYSVDSQGKFTASGDESDPGTYSYVGGVNSTHDVVTIADVGQPSSPNGAVMVLNTGTFSNADFSGSWAFAGADGTSGSITFGANGKVTGGHWEDQSGDSGGFLSGSTYTVTTNGLVTISLIEPEPGSPGQTQVISLSGAMNSSKDVLALDEAPNPDDLTYPTLLVMTKHTGSFALSDLSGAWPLVSDGVDGDVVFNGAGKITGGSYTDENGTFSILSGKYTVSGNGQVTSSIVTNEPGNTTISMTGSLNSSKNVLALGNSLKGSKYADDGFLDILTNPSPTDLTDQIGTVTLPSPAVPGDRGNVTVIVTNQGQVRADGSMTLDLYASTDEDIGDAFLLSGGVLANQSVNLGYGQFKAYTFNNVQLPQLPAGTYYLLAVVNTTESIPESNYANNTASAPEQMVYEFGTIGTRKNVTLNLTDSDGTLASFSLSGAGTGMVTVSAGVWDLDVNSTTATTAPSVTITTKSATPADNLINLDDITVEGPLKSFTAATTDLTDSLTAGSTLGTLTLDDLTGDGTVSIGGAATNLTKLTFNQVEDESLISGSAIESLTVASWEDAGGMDTITAPGLASARITGGNLAANMNLGAGSLGNLSVTGGAISGIISAARIGKVTLTGGDMSGSISSTATAAQLGKLSGIGKFSVAGGDITGNLSSYGNVGTISAALDSHSGLGGNASGQFNFGGGLASFTLSGWMENSQLLTGGSIGSVTVGGMQNSVAFAGVNTSNLTESDGVWELPSAQSDFSAEVEIGSLTVRGLKTGTTPITSFINSNIAAWSLGAVSLAYPNEATGVATFGVACTEYGTFSYRDATGTKSWTKSNPAATLLGDGTVRLITV